ncbi:MAG: O-sialoglycoprotein endopeptidase [Clostridiales bacterium]|nr:O-sialoglycoprotein endopeptidase [Clostridiales bacterium]
MKAVLGLDTSCYTTSCAVVDQGFNLISSSRMLLPVEPGARGLRQSEAVFAHVRQLPQVVVEALDGVDAQIDAICVSDRPVDGEDSYMPVFRAGLSLAQSMAAALRVPCYTTTHQRGHLAAALIGQPKPPQRFLALHLSGGTTELLASEGDRLMAVMGSLDLHAGQLIDRVGVRLGLPFPAGPALEKLALTGRAKGRYGASVSREGCHFSGAEAQAMRDAEQGELAPQDIAAEVFDLVARTVIRMLTLGREATGLDDAVIFGGVASSALLRQMLERRNTDRRTGMRLCYGRPELSGDNAAGVAMIGARRHFLTS